jgi:glycosyltransferase involved in cell wall biosynthesis
VDPHRKIILITYGNFPFGGATANFQRLFTLALRFQNYQVEVILPTGNYYGTHIDQNNVRYGNIGGVLFKHLCFINHPKNYLGKIIDNLFGLIFSLFYLTKKSILGILDIIIIYDTAFMPTLFTIIFSKILHKKLIIIIPEYIEKPSTPLLSISLLHWYSFYLGIRFVAKYADGFIVLTSFLEKYLHNKLNVHKTILLIPNLTDPKEFKALKTEPYYPNKITIGYVGTPTKKDGILDLIRSFGILHKKYSNTHLLIIGDITNGKTVIPSLKKYTTENLVYENVTFTGLVQHDKIPGLLNSCQILALTRPNGIFAESGFPIKLGEYFACKKPVLITKVGDIPYYFINQEHVILVEPENIESIVNGFEILINNLALQKKISDNGYNWMDQNTNYLKVSTRLAKFFEHLY